MKKEAHKYKFRFSANLELDEDVFISTDTYNLLVNNEDSSLHCDRDIVTMIINEYFTEDKIKEIKDKFAKRIYSEGIIDVNDVDTDLYEVDESKIWK